MVVVVLFAAFFAMMYATSPLPPCDIPVPPILLQAPYGSEELAFLTEGSTFSYTEISPQAPVSHLRFELAEYQVTDNHRGPGTVVRSGPLGSLNRTGPLQFHDVSTEAKFDPGSDFFILLDPPSVTVQLRILDPDGRAIAWNMITGCV